MQMGAKDSWRSHRPGERAVRGRSRAASNSIETMPPEREVQRKILARCGKTLGELKLNFEALTKEQEELGLAPPTVTRQALERAGATV